MSAPGSYIDLKRTWKTGDTVTLTLRKALRLEPTPDNPRRAALMWGPLVLAADLGPETARRRGAPPALPPVLLTADRPVATWLKPDPARPGVFVAVAAGRAGSSTSAPLDITFEPFYRLHERTYAVYWDLFTPAEWDKRAAKSPSK